MSGTGRAAAWAIPFPSRPHPRGDALFFLADGIGVNGRGGQLGVSHPLRQHVYGNAVHGGVDPEPVAQTFRTAVRRVGNACLDHHGLDDLPDTHAGQIPNRPAGESGRFLRLPDAMRGVEGVEIIRRHRNGPVDDLRLARPVLALFQAAQRHRAAGQVHAGRGDLDQLGRPAPGIVQRFAQGAVAGGFAPRHL